MRNRYFNSGAMAVVIAGVLFITFCARQESRTELSQADCYKLVETGQFYRFDIACNHHEWNFQEWLRIMRAEKNARRLYARHME